MCWRGLGLCKDLLLLILIRFNRIACYATLGCRPEGLALSGRGTSGPCAWHYHGVSVRRRHKNGMRVGERGNAYLRPRTCVASGAMTASWTLRAMRRPRACSVSRESRQRVRFGSV